MLGSSVSCSDVARGRFRLLCLRGLSWIGGAGEVGSWVEEESLRRLRGRAEEWVVVPLPAGASVAVSWWGGGAIDSDAGVSLAGGLAGGPADAMGEALVVSWLSSARTGRSDEEEEAKRLLCCPHRAQDICFRRVAREIGCSLGGSACSVAEELSNTWQA